MGDFSFELLDADVATPIEFVDDFEDSPSRGAIPKPPSIFV